MSTLEQMEKNKVKVKFTVTPERFREGLQYSYNKNKNSVTLPGFRKGKAPRKLIEHMYGKEFFHQDALDFVLPKAYEDVCEELSVEPVYRPSITLDEADENRGVFFTAEIIVKPEVSIDGYYGILYNKFDKAVTDSDVQEKLQQEREKNARQVSVERPAEMGDLLTINFTGFIDDIPFEGGEGKDYDLTLGSHTFIDTFEDQLVGCSVGDDVSVNVRFPDDYHREEYSGKDAVFDVEVLDIKTKEYPELDDDFAQDVSEFDTLAEYREQISEQIAKKKETEAEDHKRLDVINKLSELIEADIPNEMYENRLDDMLYEFDMRLRYDGMSFEAYSNFTGQSAEALKETWRHNAIVDVRSALALEAIAKKEGLAVTDDEFREYIQNNMRPGQDADEYIAKLTASRRKELTSSILNRKAMDFVLEKAIESDKTEE